jgi:hypothetical protein
MISGWAVGRRAWRRGWRDCDTPFTGQGLPVTTGCRCCCSWLIRPGPTDFEDHAEHEYMTMVAEHPDWERTPLESGFADDYGHFVSLADLFRQIGHDERLHRQESEGLMQQPRFR